MGLCEKCKKFIRGKTKAALKKKKASGVKLGRPTEPSDSRIVRLREDGYSYADIQNELWISKGAVCRALRKHKFDILKCLEKLSFNDRCHYSFQPASSHRRIGYLSIFAIFYKGLKSLQEEEFSILFYKQIRSDL